MDPDALSRGARTVVVAFFGAALASCSPPPPNAPSTLTIGVLDSPAGLDPVEHPSPTVLGIARDVFETLVKTKPGSSDIEPGIARSWNVSADGTTWSFALRPGRKFSDGSAVDAAAVKTNIDRWRLTNDPNRDDLEYPAYARYFNGFDGASMIDDVRVVDSADLVIHTRVPFAPLLRDLALPAFGIGSPSVFTNDYRLYDQVPVGSGPYVVSEYQNGEHVTLTPNPYWQGVPDPLSAVIVRTIPDPATSVLALAKDDVDALADPTPDIATSVARRAGMRLVRWPSAALCYVIFDFSKPPFSDPNARRAVAESLDRKAIARVIADGIPAGGWLLPSMLGYDADTRSAARHVSAARTFFIGAGIPNGAVTLYYPSLASALLPEPEALAEEIQSDLATAGLSVTLQAIGTSDIPPSAGGALAIGVAEAPSGDPDEAIAPLAASWHDPTFVTLVNQGRIAMNEGARARIYRQVDALIASDVAAIPLAYTAPVAAVSDRARGPFDSALLPPGLERK